MASDSICTNASYPKTGLLRKVTSAPDTPHDVPFTNTLRAILLIDQCRSQIRTNNSRSGRRRGAATKKLTIARPQHFTFRASIFRVWSRKRAASVACRLGPAAIHRLRRPPARREEVMPVQPAVRYHLQALFTWFEFSRGCVRWYGPRSETKFL